VDSGSTGCTSAFLARLRGLREQHTLVSFSVGFAIDAHVRTAIRHLPAGAWTPAVDIDSEVRDGAWVAEITGLLELLATPIVRRERSHPGAQLTLFDQEKGLRHLAFATDTPHGRGGAIAFLEASHRAHTRVEDRIRTGKNTGIGRFPSRLFAVNQAWLELALTAIDLPAWTQTMLLDGELAFAEPKTLRYRLLHVAAWIMPTELMTPAPSTRLVQRAEHRTIVALDIDRKQRRHGPGYGCQTLKRSAPLHRNVPRTGAHLSSRAGLTPLLSCSYSLMESIRIAASWRSGVSSASCRRRGAFDSQPAWPCRLRQISMRDRQIGRFGSPSTPECPWSGVRTVPALTVQ
jgi:hypothetical protein